MKKKARVRLYHLKLNSQNTDYKISRLRYDRTVTGCSILIFIPSRRKFIELVRAAVVDHFEKVLIL